MKSNREYMRSVAARGIEAASAQPPIGGERTVERN
jgi:hypothetical protein